MLLTLVFEPLRRSRSDGAPLRSLPREKWWYDTGPGVLRTAIPLSRASSVSCWFIYIYYIY